MKKDYVGFFKTALKTVAKIVPPPLKNQMWTNEHI